MRMRVYLPHAHMRVYLQRVVRKVEMVDVRGDLQVT